MLRFLVLIMAIYHFRTVIQGACFGNGLTGTSSAGHEIRVMDGVRLSTGATCIVAVRPSPNVSFVEAKKRCPEEFADGQLMTAYNMMKFSTSWRKFNYSNWHWLWFGRQPEPYICSVIHCMTGKAIQYLNQICNSENKTTHHDYICEYRYQYTCAYKIVFQDGPMIDSKGECIAEVRTFWQHSDADPHLNCSMAHKSYVHYSIDFCECIKNSRWSKWTEWSQCSGLCGIRSRTRISECSGEPQVEKNSCETDKKGCDRITTETETKTESGNGNAPSQQALLTTGTIFAIVGPVLVVIGTLCLLCSKFHTNTSRPPSNSSAISKYSKAKRIRPMACIRKYKESADL